MPKSRLGSENGNHKNYQSLINQNDASEAELESEPDAGSELKTGARVGGQSEGIVSDRHVITKRPSTNTAPAASSSSSSSTSRTVSTALSLSTQFELVTAFYELEDVRIPPPLLSLKLFYIFFLAVGIPIGKVRTKSKPKSEFDSESDQEEETKWRAKLKSKSDRYIDGDNADIDLSKFGTSPVYPAGIGWMRMSKVQYFHTALCLIAVFIYSVMSVQQAMLSTTRFLRFIFTFCLILSVLASVALSHDVLTRRLIGTKIYYAVANTSGRKKVISQINFALYVQLFICICLAAVGTLADCTANQRNEQLRGSAIAWTLWSVSSFVVNLQLVSGVAVFGGVAGMHLIRIQSSTRLLKRPGTTVKTALAHLFDVDVSLSDLSQILDFRLTFLLATSFLSFFFQSIALSNEQRDRHQDDGTYWDLLLLVHPGFVAAYILAGCSTLNSAAQHMKSVAFRFGIFQQRIQTHQIQKQQQKKKKEDSEFDTSSSSSSPSSSSSSSLVPNAETERIYRLLKKKEADGEGENEGDGNENGKSVADEFRDTYKDNKPLTANSSAIAAQAASEALSDSEDEEKADKSNPKPKSKSASNSKSKSKSQPRVSPDVDEKSRKTAMQQDLEKQVRQIKMRKVKKTQDEKDEEAEKLAEELEEQENTLYLNQLFSYLGACDISFRLANIQLDSSIVWGFVVVSTSAVFSLLDIDQLSFL